MNRFLSREPLGSLVYIAPATKGTYRMLILDSHESHYSTEFEHYCQDNNIKTLCMPVHLSYKCQPLDISWFGPLKRVYGRQIEDLIHTNINHVSKLEFLYVFREVFFASITGEQYTGWLCRGWLSSVQSREGALSTGYSTSHTNTPTLTARYYTTLGLPDTTQPSRSQRTVNSY